MDRIVYREAATLSRDLGLGLHTLYAVSNNLDAHYRIVHLPKKDGGTRRLLVPDETLKGIQRRIARTLLNRMPVSPYATAYRYGGGIIKNARPHVGRQTLLKLDISHFFDSVLYRQVKDAAFPAETYAEPLRVLLAMLCYYRDALPQGAPTSPWIANLILRGFDEEMGVYCAARGIRYTRYCDDLTFSGEGTLTGVREFAADGLRRRGFLLNGAKTKCMHTGQRQTVTGLTVNEQLRAPAAYRRELRQAFYYCRRFGVGQHLERTGSTLSAHAYLQSLAGKADFVLQADPRDRDAAACKEWIRQQMERGAGGCT